MILNFQNDKNFTLKGRIIWHDKATSSYGVDLSEYETNFPDYFEGYLSALETTKKVIDRREKTDRRETKIDGENLKTRKTDRREEKPFFLKCKKYNLIKNLMKDGNCFFLRELATGSMNKIIVNGKEFLNFGSNNYLGLTYHPEVKEAGIKAIEKYGLGSGGVRVLSGTIDLHNQLERKLANFKGGEDCIVYPSGYSGNVGVVSGLAGKDDVLIIDEKAHASLIDGCILSGAVFEKFRHNNLEDLEKKLNKYSNNQSRLIITDGVFSMDGDICPLPELYAIANKYNAAILVDDAHATGVIGENGRGTASHFGMEGKISLNVGTLSKGLGNIGGFTVASKDIVHYLKHNSRAFLFSTSLPPSICAGTMKAIEILERDTTIMDALWRNIKFLTSELQNLGFDLGDTKTAIIPIMVYDDVKIHKFVRLLADEGIFLNSVIYPAVKRKQARARLSLMATHTQQDLEILVSILKKAGKKMEII